MFKLFILIVPFLLFKSFFTLHFFCHLAFSPCISPFEGDNIPLRFRSSPPLKGGWGDVLLRSVICHSERSFCYFWLDPKVTKKSRLRALHTTSLRLQVGKSGNLLRFGQPDFLSPRSLLHRLTARGPWVNAEIDGKLLIVNDYAGLSECKFHEWAQIKICVPCHITCETCGI